MRKIFFIATMFMASVATHAQSGGGTVVKIKTDNKPQKKTFTSREAREAEYYAECTKHKHHEVEIVRTPANDQNRYEVVYYQKENDTMKSHKFMVGLKEIYEKAEYTWDHDTVGVSFFSQPDKKSKVYKGYGWGSTSSMFIDD